MKNNKGITLIALIITIIVLLILAGVSIAMLAGDNNIFSRATEASTNTKLTNVQDLLGVEISDAVTAYYEKSYVDADAEINNDNVGDSVKATVENVVKNFDLPDGVTSTEVGGTFTYSDGATITLTCDRVKTVGTFKGIALTWTAPEKAGT